MSKQQAPESDCAAVSTDGVFPNHDRRTGRSVLRGIWRLRTGASLKGRVCERLQLWSKIRSRRSRLGEAARRHQGMHGAPLLGPAEAHRLFVLATQDGATAPHSFPYYLPVNQCHLGLSP